MKRLLFGVIFAIAFMAFSGLTAYASDISADEVELPYVVADGTTYWESSWNFGTGRHGVVNEENPYTTTPCYAGINGYSYLNGNGNILVSDYIETENDIVIPSAPDGAVKLFVHFKSTSFRNGWVDADNVSLIKAEELPEETEPTFPTTLEPEKQNSEELAEMIQQYDGMTVVIVDRSSSMDDFADKATVEFRNLNIDEQTTKVYVFGRYFKEIQAKEITNENRDVRQDEQRYDYLAEVINDAGKYNPKHIIILTDLGVYEGNLATQSNLETIDILVPSDNWYGEMERSDFIKKAFPDVKITIRQFE